MVKRQPIRSSRTQGNSPCKEKIAGTSQTVPDQSYTVREILVKFASGTLPNIYAEPEFSEDLPDLRGLDISEIHAIKQQNAKEIKDKENDLEDLKRKKKETPPEPPTPPIPPINPPLDA